MEPLSTKTPDSPSQPVVRNIKQLIINRDAFGLLALLEPGDQNSCDQIWEALEELGECALEALVVALRYQNWKMRWKSARLLGQSQDLRAVKPLINGLKDSNRIVRFYAAEALGKIGDEFAVGPLTAALTDESQAVREASRTALENIRKRKASSHPYSCRS